MARVKSNLKDLSTKIGQSFAETKSLLQTGEFIAKRVRGFTRLGFSLDGNPDTPKSNKLPPLTLGYIKTRAFWKDNPGKSGISLDPSFVARRSQLTVTGQLLRSIAYTANPSKKSVRVYIPNTMRTDRNTNKEVAEKVVDRGYPFMGLDKVGLETIKIRYVKSLLRRLGR